MAITTLTPKIRVCFTDSCSKIKVYDTTGAESTANAGGYGATNVLPAAISTAVLSYTAPGGSQVDLDVVANVNAQAVVAGEFLIAEIDISAKDGSYSFIYTLTDGGLTVTRHHSIYTLCVVRCCIDKLWAKAALDLVEADCNCSDKTSYMNRATQAEAIYMAIRNGASCNNPGVRDSLLAKLQRICKLEKCNCK
jgi:hypothetical protein